MALLCKSFQFRGKVIVKVLHDRILEEFATLAFAAEAFPMLTEWGVEDFSLTIHSLGCNYLSALGRHMGFWAISEYPVRITTAGSARSIRPDVAWWFKPEANIALIGEFERFDPHQKQKLVGKARNLLQIHHEIGDQARILLLLAWTLSGTDMSVLTEVRALGHNGFRTGNGSFISGLGPGCAFIVAVAVFGAVNGVHRLQRIHV
jgi:hypothetical protein